MDDVGDVDSVLGIGCEEGQFMDFALCQVGLCSDGRS